MTKKQEHWLVALCSLLYFTSYFTRKNFAAVMVEMISIGLFDKESAGMIVSALFITYGAGQILSGFLGDRFSPSHLIVCGLALTTVCNLAMPHAAGKAWLCMVIWGVNGLAQALFWPPLVRLLSENLTHDGFVRANLVVTAAAHSATILIFLFTAFCLSFVDWRTAFYGPAVLSGAMLVLWLAGMRLLRPARKKSRQVQDPIKTEVIGGRQFMPLLLAAGLVPILLVIVLQGYLRDGIDAWLPTFFSEVFSQGSASSVLASVVLPIFAILSVYAAGALHRRFLRNEVVGALFFFALSLIVSLPLLLCMEWGHPAASVISLISVALFSGSMHALNFMLISCLPARFVRYGRAATTSGICNAATYIGSATASYGIALTANTLGWKATVLSWLGIAVLGLLACLLALRPYTRFLNKKEG
ncbi:MAG: MFS transporter [Clostridia bacterium]|nr:MFS transporter [Clostridia bacterium]